MTKGRKIKWSRHNCFHIIKQIKHFPIIIPLRICRGQVIGDDLLKNHHRLFDDIIHFIMYLILMIHKWKNTLIRSV